jgi:hypothetical protein
MIIKSLLAVAIAAATLNPTPAAEQGMPATSISSHQPASVESSTTRAEVGQTTSPVAPRMAQRGITKAQIEAVVASPDPGVYQDDNDTWLINNGYLIVVINKNAWIVTGIKGQM